MSARNGRFLESFLFITLILAGLALSLTAALPPAQADPANVAGEAAAATHIIRFEAPAVIPYQTQQQPAAAFALNAAAQTYQQQLVQAQNQALTHIAQTIRRIPTIHHRYTLAVNGVALTLTPAEAAAIADLPQVTAVSATRFYQPATDAGPAWIGAPGVWDGSQTGGLPGSRGEGILVGIIDTGINMDHPSFAAVGGDGYAHVNPFGPGQYLGHCASQPVTFVCNDKLVGAYSWPEVGDSPEDDYGGHGSNVSGIAAGNIITIPYTAPTLTLTPTLSGAAPHATLIAYDVCKPGIGCPDPVVLAAIEQAILNGVDVINFSIGDEALDPWTEDVVAEAFLAARAAGIFVAAAAGNGGPGARSINSPANAPWVTTVGNVSHHASFDNTLGALSGGDSALAEMRGSSITQAYGPAPIVAAAQAFPANAACSSAFPANTWTQGEIVYCQSGGSRAAKAQNVLAAGGGGIVINNGVTTYQLLGIDRYPLPGINLRAQEADQLAAWLASGADHTAVISGTARLFLAEYGDELFWQSSRGPSPVVTDVLKPNVVAPGTKIWAAGMTTNPAAPPELAFFTGTSQASPHVAGAAALLLALHPDWTPAEIESALMTTAVTSITDYDGTPANAFAQGAGRINVSAAAQAGLVLDETTANFQAANPAIGGTPGGLNLAGLLAENCAPVCSWTRTFRSAMANPVTWTAAFSTTDQLWLRLEPDTFTIAPGGEQAVTITALPACWQPADWRFATVRLQADGLSPDLHLPLAVRGACMATFLPVVAQTE